MNPRGKDVDTVGDIHVDTSSKDDVNVLAVLRSITRHARKEARREQGQPLVVGSCTFQQFDQKSPSTFEGGTNLIVVEDWIQEMEELLTVLHCTKEQKVQYPTFKLVGEAKRRWRSEKLVKEQHPVYTSITWSHFREVFFSRYFPVATRETKVEEFLHLTQRYMMVQQYAAKFVELSRFTPHMVPDEPLKSQMFEKRLRLGIRA
ncbi:uncharacterized protein LOC131148282 [Malania oleifera]|uniref:uncharacterized protein LOC131148282 n=1 Tax=Malania oleifera TaxID=397392 RepID=UPI0025AE5C22|nr:uncharacterized protein LOC131148282 [Malania oleifera]